MTSDPDPLWECQRGDGPIVAVALHAGHTMRDELAPYVALGPQERLREEDPWTDLWTEIAPTRVVGRRSRFELDLNRPRERAVYLHPEDAWGLTVWRAPLPDDVLARSLERYDRFYEAMRELFSQMAADYGAFVVLDLHSYNHRRAGPDSEPAPGETHPQINLGTGTMRRPQVWRPLVQRFQADLAGYPFPGGALDVRENVKFQGGFFPQWVHSHFEQTACVLSIEVKKFFMDEWTGQADPACVDAIRRALAATLPGLSDELQRVRTGFVGPG